MSSLVTKSSIELTRRDIRAIILFQFKLEKSISECHQNFITAFPNNKVSLATVKRWYREFKCGNFNLEDQHKPGPPLTAVTEKNVESIGDMVIADPNITYERIQNELHVSSGIVHSILHDSLQLSKLCARWIPHQLHPQQKNARVNWCKEMLKKFNHGRSRDVAKIITGDETWILPL